MSTTQGQEQGQKAVSRHSLSSARSDARPVSLHDRALSWGLTVLNACAIPAPGRHAAADLGRAFADMALACGASDATYLGRPGNEHDKGLVVVAVRAPSGVLVHYHIGLVSADKTHRTFVWGFNTVKILDKQHPNIPEGSGYVDPSLPGYRCEAMEGAACVLPAPSDAPKHLTFDVLESCRETDPGAVLVGDHGWFWVVATCEGLQRALYTRRGLERYSARYKRGKAYIVKKR